MPEESEGGVGSLQPPAAGSRASSADRRRRTSYERRRPENSALHFVVREHLETFLTTVREERGKDLPHYVEQEPPALRYETLRSGNIMPQLLGPTDVWIRGALGGERADTMHLLFRRRPPLFGIVTWTHHAFLS